MKPIAKKLVVGCDGILMIDLLPVWTQWVVFGLSITGILAILSLAALATGLSSFTFFPPPSKDSWQHGTFLTLFRLHLYPLIALTAIVFDPLGGLRAKVQYGVGGLLLIIGFGMAIRITLQMGWRNAFGEKLGLITTGWFAWSRNPIYVFTWLGIVGWALIANHWLITILLSGWTLMYLIAPHFEEPWLESEYGDEYADYKSRVRRFI